MKKILALLMCFPLSGFATTWLVGPAQQYTMPSQVSTLVNHGDTILIDPGTYTADVCYWDKNDLVLKGAGPGYSHLDANGAAYGGKAIWVIGGDNNRVENIEFSNCAVVDHNGAGIRQEGFNLTVSHCYFHHNEMGLLAGDITGSKIVIEYSELSFNGFGDGLSHNVYVNRIDTFLFRYNYSHDAHVGHEVKSRAKNNYILYNRITSELGTDSRNIDLPNGGKSFLIGNIINQQQASQNNNLVGFALEGPANAALNELYVINNTLINEKAVGSFFDLHPNTELFKAYNNVCAGAGTFYTNSPLVVDTMNNYIVNTYGGLMFQNPAVYQYQISYPVYGSSPLFNGGTNPGNAGNYSLIPDRIYVHPRNFASRCTNGPLDIGAYEECAPTTLIDPELSAYSIYPNPAQHEIFIAEPVSDVKMYDMYGHPVLHSVEQHIRFNLAKGIYLLQITDRNGKSTVKKVFIE